MVSDGGQRGPPRGLRLFFYRAGCGVPPSIPSLPHSLTPPPSPPPAPYTPHIPDSSRQKDSAQEPQGMPPRYILFLTNTPTAYPLSSEKGTNKPVRFKRERDRQTERVREQHSGETSPCTNRPSSHPMSLRIVNEWQCDHTPMSLRIDCGRVCRSSACGLFTNSLGSPLCGSARAADTGAQ